MAASVSYRMSCVRSKNTYPELRMRKLLRHCKLRYRSHVTRLPGKPDFVLMDYRIAILVDGDFWHGRNADEWLCTLSSFWQDKIRTNIARDRVNRRRLRAMGYRVVRFWGSDILKRERRCHKRLMQLIDAGEL